MSSGADRGIDRAASQAGRTVEPMRAIFDASPIPTAITRRSDGRILLANRACLQLLGWDESQFIGRTMIEVGFWERPDQRARMLELLRSPGGVRDLEHEIRTKSGETLVVQTSISAVELDGEQCLVGHIHDITEHRRLEDKLRESEERFRQLTETLQDGFVLRDIDPPAILYASPAVERIFGVTREELYRDPQRLQQLIHPGDRDWITSRRDEMTHATDFEYRIVRPDGEVRWIRSRAEPVRSADGQLMRVAGISEDITDERALHEALRHSEERFRLLAENSTDIIARSSPDWTIQYMSPASRALYGYEPEEMVGRSGWEFVHPDDRAALGEELADGVGHADITNVYRVLCKDGSYVWVEANTRPLRDPVSGEISEFHTSARDISERKQAEAVIRRAKEEAEQANLHKSEFLSRMSHELRTPLHAILGFGELLARDELGPSQREALDQIVHGGRHLLELINEVLDISRIERGELRLSLEPVDVGSIVRETLDMVAPLATARSVHLLPSGGELEFHVRADRQRLKQVLLNLLSNAVKYNRDGGEVHVDACGRDGDLARIEVRDTGYGIAPADLTRAFSAFERLGAQATEVEGTGLGLTLTKRLVEAMGGAITVDSKVGRGSTFALELPVVEAPTVGQRRAAAGALEGAGGRSPGVARKVLYVEDNPSNIRLVEQILVERPEVTLLVANQGGIGLELARDHRPQLILLDLNLPDMAGDEVLRRLRGDDRTADARIVMVTADATPGQVTRLRRAGADDYLTKPFEIDRFLAAVDGTPPPHKGEPPPADAGDPPPARAVPSGPLELERLAKLRDLYPDGRGLREFVGLFLEDTPVRLAGLASAARAGDTAEVREAAHALRGSCVLTGAHRLVTLLTVVENDAQRGESPAEQRLDELDEAYREAAAALAAELGPGAGSAG